MSKITFAEFEQYVDIEDRLWHMGKEFFAEVQTHRPDALCTQPELCHYDDVYVDGTDTLDIGYECVSGNDYELIMIEVPVVDFLDDHITAAHNLESLTYETIKDVDPREQLRKTFEDIDSGFANFNG